MKITQEPTKDVSLSYKDIDYHETAYCDYCGAEALVSKKDLKYDSNDGLVLPKCPKCKHQLATVRGSTVPTISRPESDLILRHKIKYGCSTVLLVCGFAFVLFCVILTIIF